MVLTPPFSPEMTAFPQRVKESMSTVWVMLTLTSCSSLQLFSTATPAEALYGMIFTLSGALFARAVVIRPSELRLSHAASPFIRSQSMTSFCPQFMAKQYIQRARIPLNPTRSVLLSSLFITPP